MKHRTWKFRANKYKNHKNEKITKILKYKKFENFEKLKNYRMRKSLDMHYFIKVNVRELRKKKFNLTHFHPICRSTENFRLL